MSLGHLMFAATSASALCVTVSSSGTVFAFISVFSAHFSPFSFTCQVLMIAPVLSVSPCRLGFIYHRGCHPSFIYLAPSSIDSPDLNVFLVAVKRNNVCSCMNSWLYCIFHHIPCYCIISIPLPEPFMPTHWCLFLKNYRLPQTDAYSGWIVCFLSGAFKFSLWDYIFSVLCFPLRKYFSQRN